MNYDNTRVREILKQARLNKNISVEELAKRVGVAKTTIYRYESGNINKMSIDTLTKLSKLLGISPTFVLGTSDDPSFSSFIKENESANKHTKYIPIIGEIACGDPITAEENIEGYLEEPEESLPSGVVFYLNAKGHSMEPTIPNGSHVLIREQPEVEDGEIAAILVNGDTEATLKRVKHQNGIIMLIPDNKSYDPILITKENPARILGKAIRFTTDL